MTDNTCNIINCLVGKTTTLDTRIKSLENKNNDDIKNTSKWFIEAAPGPTGSPLYGPFEVNKNDTVRLIGNVGVKEGSILVDLTGLGGGTGPTGGTVQSQSNLSIRATDEGTVAGNLRGANSIDLQTGRNSATEVASGIRAIIIGGSGNKVSGDNSIIGGGFYNRVSGNNSSIGGGRFCELYGRYSTIGGGKYNRIFEDYAVVAGGYGLGRPISRQGSDYSVVGGGRYCNNEAFASTIGGGYNCRCAENYSFPGNFDEERGTIGGGFSNYTYSRLSTVAGGYYNRANNLYQNNPVDAFVSVGGGHYCKSYGRYSTIRGGKNHDTFGKYTTVGGGLDNAIGRASRPNAKNYGSTIMGGKNAEIHQGSSSGDYYSIIGGGNGNRIEGTPTKYSTIFGGRNTIGGDSLHITHIGGFRNITYSSENATIMGGKRNNIGRSNQPSNNTTIGGGFNNSIVVEEGPTIMGGLYNYANGYVSTIGGGQFNSATRAYSTIGGGGSNVASGDYSIIKGGNSNIASGNCSTIGGGNSNIVYGNGSTVGGGDSNMVYGDYSFAAGYNAVASNNNSFVWSDDSVAHVAQPNRFTVISEDSLDIVTSTETGSKIVTGNFMPIYVNGINYWIPLYLL